MIPKRFFLVFGTFLLSVLLYADRVCISVAEKPIRSELGFTEEEFSWILSAFALGYALCQTPAGWLSDRLGPRRILTAVVAFWSAFTGLTAAAFGWLSMMAARFIFGCGEAGAFPGMARATFSWIPMPERGLVQGVNFSGSRIGAAVALPVVAFMIERAGWRLTFVMLMAIGFAWAVFWWFWFRDDPSEHPRMQRDELEYILATRQRVDSEDPRESHISPSLLARSRNMWIICLQYFCSNFTFFFCLSWLYPHLKKKYGLGIVETGLYTSAPFLAGALGCWASGIIVDWIYRRGRWILSRRLPAMVGFGLAALGMAMSVYMDTALGSILWLSVAIFGADMTLPPSWSCCMDIGKRHSGVVSGTMNMAGNLGAFLTSLAFHYLREWTGTDLYFFVAAGLNAAALVLWLAARPDRSLREY